MSDVLKDLVARLGGDHYGDYVCVPGPGHSPRDRSLSVTLKSDGRLLYNSFAGDPDDLIRAHLGIQFCHGGPMGLNQSALHQRRLAQQREAEARQKLKLVGDIWEASVPIDGTLAETYLRDVRGLRNAIPPDLRFHPSAPLDYERRQWRPALIAPIIQPKGGLCALHITALRADGMGKAEMAAPRRILGANRGGVIRLGGAGATLAVAEGVETALSYATLKGATTWSAVSTSGLTSFTPPATVQRLIIAADGDKAGRHAAEALQSRLQHRIAIRIDAAPDGADWNDVLREAAE